MTEFTDGTAKFKVTKSGGVLPGTVTAFSGTFDNGSPLIKTRGWSTVSGTCATEPTARQTCGTALSTAGKQATS